MTTSADKARLNNQPGTDSEGSWVADEIDNGATWLQISLYRQVNITGVQTQGNPNADQWVTKFNVRGDLGNNIWDILILEDTGNEKVRFIGDV